jgi:hypothetical protein
VKREGEEESEGVEREKGEGGEDSSCGRVLCCDCIFYTVEWRE